MLSRCCLVLLLTLPCWVLADESELDLQARYQAADIVAQVKIRFVSGLVNRSLSMPGMLAVESFDYQSDVVRYWKGAGQKRLQFQVRQADCSQRLSENQEYILLGHDTPTGQRALDCDSLVPVTAATDLIASLDLIHAEYLAAHGAGQSVH